MCSSSVLTKFIPVFVVSNILQSFVVPILLLVLMYCSDKSRKVKVLCMSFLPPIFFPLDTVSKPLFSPDVITSKLMHHISLLLTFGVACPPLALAIMTTVCITTGAWEVVTGRYIHQRRQVTRAQTATPPVAADTKSDKESGTNGTGKGISPVQGVPLSTGQHRLEKELAALNSRCFGVGSRPETIIWVIVDTTAFFSSLFFFDISGDRSGWLVALLGFSLPVLAVPLVLRGAFAGYKRMQMKGDERPAVNVVTEQASPLACYDL